MVPLLLLKIFAQKSLQPTHHYRYKSIMTPNKAERSSVFTFLGEIAPEALAQDSSDSRQTVFSSKDISEKKNSDLETPQRKGALLSRCENCSICWSPLCKPVSLFGGAAAPENGEREEQEESKTKIMSPTVPSTPMANQKSTTQTRCGHIFHTKCLMETKLRKPECPNCRCQLTPITDPLHVSSAMQEDPELYTSSLRDAVVHAAHRGRNAVRAAMEAREAAKVREEQERLRLQSQEVQAPLASS